MKKIITSNKVKRTNIFSNYQNKNKRFFNCYKNKENKRISKRKMWI